MFSQMVIVSLALAVVAADVSSLFPRSGGVSSNSVEFDSNPQYSYSYSVNDAHTGDNHAQEETRNGDNVHGSYSLVEADGTLRTVKYTADAVNGFQAVVEHTGGAGRSYTPAAPQVVSYSTPTFVSQPAKVAVPVQQSYALRSGNNAAVHTSFSAPHASYQY